MSAQLPCEDTLSSLIITVRRQNASGQNASENCMHGRTKCRPVLGGVGQNASLMKSNTFYKPVNMHVNENMGYYFVSKF